jgi:hypothetical protein
MFASIAALMLVQFKIGDEIYIPPGGSLYRTAETASTRFGGFERPFDHGPIIAIKTIDGEKVVRFKSEKYEIPPWALAENVRKWTDAAKAEAQEHAKIERESAAKKAEVKKVEMDKMRDKNKAAARELDISRKLLDLDFDLRAAVRERLKAYDEPTVMDAERILIAIRRENQQVAMAESVRVKLGPYVQSKSESAAIEAALKIDLNPLTMSANDAAKLTSAQRRSISSVRQRYTKGARLNGPQEDR